MTATSAIAGTNVRVPEKLNKGVSKEETLEFVEQLFQTVDMFNSTLASVKSVASSKPLPGGVMFTFGNIFHVNNVSISQVVDVISKFTGILVANKDNIIGKVNRWPSVIYSSSVSAQELTVLNLIIDVQAVLDYMSSALPYMTNETHSKLPPARVKDIKDNAVGMLSLLKYYSENTSGILTHYNDMSNVRINANADTAITAMHIKNGAKAYIPPVVNNFIGSPIFAVRLWWENKKLEKMKKIELELNEFKSMVHLLELEKSEAELASTSGKTPEEVSKIKEEIANLSDQIEYYRGQISIRDKKLNEYLESAKE